MPRFRLSLALAIVLTVAVAQPALLSSSPPPSTPASLSDQEFWRLSQELSEPDGVFSSDNLLSNEMSFPRLVPGLAARAKTASVYLGVGPEQNFTYIAALKPRMAFITDIRRGNLHLQLMYKALFELSSDRAEFISRLFTKPRPAGLTATSSAADLMNAYWDVYTADEAAYRANLEAIEGVLTKTHALPLSPDDLAGVARVYRAFYWYGPSMTYTASTALTPLVPQGLDATQVRLFVGTTYADLMMQADVNGGELSYLASEASFSFLKDLQRKNLVVPIVGNFAGPKALRAVGTYIKQHRAIVSAFYVSNVEQYLMRDETWPAFCANVGSLPLDKTSVLIRPGAVPTVTRTKNEDDGTIRVSFQSNRYGPSGLVSLAVGSQGCVVPR